MNRELIRDERSENRMNLVELEERMRGFLSADYKAVIIVTDGLTAGYCLYRRDSRQDSGGFDINVRQYYIKPAFRHKGLGRKAFMQIRENIFSDASELRLDVLEANPAGMAFWTKTGFVPYCHNLRLKNK